MSRWRAFVATWVWPLVLFVMALAPRVPGLRLFVTSDESFNTRQSLQVVRAFLEGDWRSTYWHFYPGLTISWLDGLGTFVQWCLARLTGSTVEPYAQFIQRDILDLLLAVRLPYALLSALFVVATYGLVRRLAGQRVALLGALFVAWDPFFVAHSRVSHADAPLAVFMGLSVLAYVVHLQRPAGRDRPVGRWLLLSAVMGGLAALTKSPGPFVLPFVVLLGLGDWWCRSRASRHLDGQLGRRRLIETAVWCVVAGLVFVSLWPAMWVDPVGTLSRMFDETFGKVEAGHLVFFMGQPTLDPGPWFYPYVVPFRTSPAIWLGLAASAAVLAWRGLRRSSVESGERAVAGILWAFVVSLLLFAEICAKKQDRYLLALFPMLDILAAFGFVWIAGLCEQLVARCSRLSTALASMGVVILATIVHGYPMLTNYPYYLAYFDPLMGGLSRAVETTLVGWGEGMEQVAAYLNTQPNAAKMSVAAVPVQTLLPYFAGTGDNFYTNDVALRADRVVLYISQLQRLAPSPEIVRYFRAREPEHVVQVLGVPYAWVYRGPKLIVPDLPADAWPVNVGVGEQLRLAGYRVSSQSDAVAVTLFWHALADIQTDYTVSVRLVGSDGGWLAQHDGWPAEGLLPTHQLRSGDYVRDVHTLQPTNDQEVAAIQVVVYDAATDRPLGAPIDLPAQHEATELKTNGRIGSYPIARTTPEAQKLALLAPGEGAP
jgi:hypothetical protein